MKKVFIDGSAGTTGLRIRERLSRRTDVELVVLPDELRKDPAARRDALHACDLAFLCLPDEAAREAVRLAEGSDAIIIDTSTAHRTADGWTYGFPELFGQRERIRSSKRIANPGCHATGFIALVEPLVRAGILPRSARLNAFSLTGFSGGGKKMIGEYERLKSGKVEEWKSAGEGLKGGKVEECESAGDELFLGGRQYALGQRHKHLPEMAKVCGLDAEPCFSPVVVPHLSGMEVTVQAFAEDFSSSSRDGLVAALANVYRDAYRDGGVVRFVEDPSAAEGGFLSSAALSGRDSLEVSVFGNDKRILLVARFDNLGKGASGAAIQNMNIALGFPETSGLVL